MKLLVIISLYPPHNVGGYEIRCKNVIDGLLSRGHDVVIITSHYQNQKNRIHPNENCIYRTLHQKSEASNVITQMAHDYHDMSFIAKKIREFHPDVIYLWQIDDLSNAIFPYISHQKKPIVIDDGSSQMVFLNNLLANGLYFEKNEKDIILEKMIKRSIELLIKVLSFNMIMPAWDWPRFMLIYFNSYSSLKYSRDCGAPVENAYVIQPGIDLSKFPMRLKYNNNHAIKIIVPGRIVSQKGTRDSVHLAKKLLNDNLNIKINLIGNIDSQVFFDEIMEMIKQNELTDVLEYFPMVSQDDLAYIYQESDFCFFSSYFKTGLSRVPLEAMASGCLVISYGNEGSNEIIQDQETGFIVPEGDYYAVARIIEKMIKKPDHYQKIIEAARRQIEQKHSLDSYIEKIESLITKSIAVD